jgi:hypothetical protein
MMCVLSCHSERSEESLIIRSASLAKLSQRCFASLNMTHKKSEEIDRMIEILHAAVRFFK